MMKRLKNLFVLAGAIAVLSLSAGETAKRPNILFAFADDWGRYASVYAKLQGEKSINHVLKTPNVDRIAREGALFTEAFIPSPSCTPCRSSLMSGRYFWQTGLGAILQSAVWDDEIPTFPRILRASGYHTGASYKTWSPGFAPGVHPMGPPECFYNKAGSQFTKFSTYVTKRVKGGVSVKDAKQELYDEVLKNFTDFMDDRKEGQPFFYWWGAKNTHRSWAKGSGAAQWGLKPDDLKGRLPGFLPDVHEIREDFVDYLGECMAFDAGLGVILKELERRGELDNTLIVVSGDHGIPGFPRAKCNLYDIGNEVALMARLPGSIAKGTVIKDLTNIMDLAPTFLEAAGCQPEPSMTSSSLWDRITGKSGPKKENWVITGRERHYAEAREGNLPYPQRAIRTKDFLYIHNFAPDRWPMGKTKGRKQTDGMENLSAKPLSYTNIESYTGVVYPDFDASPTKAWMIYNRAKPEHTKSFLLAFGKRPREELYDLRKDRDQMTNVAQSPEYQETCKALREKLMTELRKQRDPRVIDKDCRFDKSPFTDVSHKKKGGERGSAKPRILQARAFDTETSNIKTNP